MLMVIFRKYSIVKKYLALSKPHFLITKLLTSSANFHICFMNCRVRANETSSTLFQHVVCDLLCYEVGNLKMLTQKVFKFMSSQFYDFSVLGERKIFLTSLDTLILEDPS